MLTFVFFTVAIMTIFTTPLSMALKENKPLKPTMKWVWVGLGLTSVYWIWHFKFSEPANEFEAERNWEYTKQCESMIRAQLGENYRLEIFSLTGSAGDNEGPGGSRRVVLDFDATNAFGVKTEHKALCMFNGEPRVRIMMRK